MRFYPDKVYHIYNRGNNSQRIFFNRENYLFFLRKIRNSFLDDCHILAYCLMPNHFHMMIQPTEKGCFQKEGQVVPVQSLTSKIATLQSSYTRAIQNQENIKGSLFQQKTKAKLLATDALPSKNIVATCLHYIHQNPLKAGLVNQLEDWEFSSYNDYAGIRNGTLCNRELVYELADMQLETFVKDSYGVIKDEILERIIY